MTDTTAGEGVYVASRASIPERSAMWRMHRDHGRPIISTWIDEAGEGESRDLGELWERILVEVTTAKALILYAEAEDFPLKGAFIEVGMALGSGVPVFVVLDGVDLEPRSLRPLGSWAKHALVTFAPSVTDAFRSIEALAAQPSAGAQDTVRVPFSATNDMIQRINAWADDPSMDGGALYDAIIGHYAAPYSHTPAQPSPAPARSSA